MLEPQIGATIDYVAKQASKFGKVYRDGNFYKVDYKGFVISWARNGHSNDATNFYVKKKVWKDDLQTDYFSGTFFDNFSQCVKFIDRY